MLRPADISIQQPWKHIIKQQGTQFFSESPCVETRQCWTCASAPSSVSWRTGFCMPAQWEDTSITTKAWGHFSWTFEEAPRRAASAAREHLNGTLFDETEVEEEGPPEEADLIFHDDDDDDDAEDPESTDTVLSLAAARHQKGSLLISVQEKTRSGVEGQENPGLAWGNAKKKRTAECIVAIWTQRVPVSTATLCIFVRDCMWASR